MTVYALNGLGRIGKLALKPLFINDRGRRSGDACASSGIRHMHGRWDAAFDDDEGSVTVDGVRLPFVGVRDLAALPLDGVDVVIDCTGVFKTEAKRAPRSLPLGCSHRRSIAASDTDGH
jgi:glyceraldehyde 3-phosphate dehydrogenase